MTLVYSPKQCVEVRGGNVGLTKGGTGDVQAGLTVALLAKNEPFLAAQTASYVVKKAGDELTLEFGIYYNADDLARKVPEVLKISLSDSVFTAKNALIWVNVYSPKYIVSNKVLKNVGSLEASREVIENAPLVPSFEKQFQSDALIRTIHHGTHIEGNDLTLYQTKKVLEGEEVYARARDIQEVINYRNVAKLLDELAVKRGGYELDMLRDIHRNTVDRIIAPDKVGVFRTTEVVIKEEGSGKVIFSPPPSHEIPYLLEDFFVWLNDTESSEIHPVIRAGIAHYILVTIHPFVEGNGRTIRAFATLILMREGYDVKKFFSIEEHFDQDLAGYYDAFTQVDSQSPNIGKLFPVLPRKNKSSP